MLPDFFDAKELNYPERVRDGVLLQTQGEEKRRKKEGEIEKDKDGGERRKEEKERK